MKTYLPGRGIFVVDILRARISGDSGFPPSVHVEVQQGFLNDKYGKCDYCSIFFGAIAYLNFDAELNYKHTYKSHSNPQ